MIKTTPFEMVFIIRECMRVYSGELCDENLNEIFQGAADFMRRELLCGVHRVYAYAIDGLIASSEASDYIFKPIANISHRVTTEIVCNRLKYIIMWQRGAMI